MFDKLLENCINEMEKLAYLGSCKNIVDPEDTEAVSALSMLVEGGKEITRDEFYRIALHTLAIGMPPKEDVDAAFGGGDVDDYTFHYNRDENIAWIYDSLEDVEYFYGLNFPI